MGLSRESTRLIPVDADLIINDWIFVYRAYIYLQFQYYEWIVPPML